MSQSRSQRRNRYTPTTARSPRVGVLGALLLHGMIALAAIFTWQHHLEIIDQSAPVRTDVDASAWVPNHLIPKPGGDYFDI